MNSAKRMLQLEQSIERSQAEINEIKSQKGTRYQPKHAYECWHVSPAGAPFMSINKESSFDLGCYKNFNSFETKEVTAKAAAWMHWNNAIIMACLSVDPDFVPDYSSGNQVHYSFWYEEGSIGHEGGWRLSKSYTLDVGPSVSTEEKWHEAAALLKEWVRQNDLVTWMRLNK